MQRAKRNAKALSVPAKQASEALSPPTTLGARLKRLVEVQLSRMERFMITASPGSGQEAEREVRALRGLVENLNKVSEAANAIDGTGGADRCGSRDAWLEAERLRREITERLERLDREWFARDEPE